MRNIGTVFKKLLFLLLFFLSSATIKAQDNTTYDWQKLFYKAYYTGYRGQTPLRQYWFSLSTSNNVVDLQALSYGLDAILAMFEATDSSKYLDDAIRITNNVIDSSQISNKIVGNQSNFRDNYRGWIERKSNEPSIYMKETVLSEIYFFQYVSRLLKDIHSNDSLYQIPKYNYFYFQTLSFVENNIWDKWVNRGMQIKNKFAYLMLGRTHMASHWAYIAAELSFLTTNAKRKNDYLEFVNLYNDLLEKNFIRFNKFIKWNSTWDFGENGMPTKISPIIQDVSHANLVVSYIVEASELGLWTDRDAIKRIINTVKYKLWDGKTCTFSDYMDGGNFLNEQHSSVGSFQADGFVKLSRYDRSLFDIYEKFVSCSKYLTAWYQHGQLYANMALSSKILKNQGS